MPNQQRLSWRHHYVPAWFLSNFGSTATEKRKSLLWCYDFAERKRFTQTAENVAYAPDFNTALVNGEPTDYFEQKVRILEDLIGPRVDGFRSTPSHDPDGIFWVLAAIALFAGKNPATRLKVSKANEEAFYRGAADLVSSRENYELFAQLAPLLGLVHSSMPFEEAEKAVETRSLPIGILQNYLLYSELSAVAETVKTCLLPRKWLVFQTDPEETGGFITSDNPIARRVDKNGAPYAGFGLGRADTTIVFAIARELAVIGDFDGEEGLKTADSKRVAWINNSTIAYCSRQIYARDENFLYAYDSKVRCATHLREDWAWRGSQDVWTSN